MCKAIVFLFSGQGSQYYHMGKQLFNQHLVFHRWMLKMDDIVQQIIGKSIIAEMYDGKKQKYENFNRTLFTHPAIFMVEYSLVQVLLASGIKPDYVLGTSLGEFTAAAVSGIMKVEDILECLLKQAESFESLCENSGMLAIIDSPNLYHENLPVFKGSELASINYCSHFVVSGNNDKLKQIINFLKQKDVTYQLLPVSFGFHSSYIDAAGKMNTDFLKTKFFKKPAMPYISGLYGNQLNEISDTYFWDVVRKPVQFQKAVQKLEENQECTYLDLGPSGTLANFTKYNLSKDSISQCYPIITPFNQDLKNLKIIEGLCKNRFFEIQEGR